MVINKQVEEIDELKAKLDALRPLPPELIKNLEEWYKVELTYNSNAIEGNSLTRAETALVVEKGITVRGKTLPEHLEAINHAEALDYIKKLANENLTELTERDILQIHRLILKKIDDANAGRYRRVNVSISGSDVRLPAPHEVAALMEEFMHWLTSTNTDHPVKIAVDAHYKLVSIHPFVDGNGRTARLLTNLLLMQKGYAPCVIRIEIREEYIAALQKAHKTGFMGDYYDVMYGEIERTMKEYLEHIQPTATKELEEKVSTQYGTEKGLLKIGELAKLANESIATVRVWQEAGLIDVKDYTVGRFQLFDPSMVGQAKEIRRLQTQERLTLAEIKVRLRNN